MEIVYILLALAAGLLFYQLFIYKDPDKLDATGHPVNKPRKAEVKN